MGAPRSESMSASSREALPASLSRPLQGGMTTPGGSFAVALSAIFALLAETLYKRRRILLVREGKRVRVAGLPACLAEDHAVLGVGDDELLLLVIPALEHTVRAELVALHTVCLLYTSDAADDLLCVDLGGRRIIKKKKKK